jgi:glycosyltransferase involved in cell wall biosynthesis
VSTINNPLVSCIFLSYNHENFVVESISGMFNQTYKNLEYIISDDSSEDSSYKNILDKVGELSDDVKNRIIYLSKNEKNLGINLHLSKLFKLCNGELIVIFSADDLFSNERVNFLVQKYNIHQYSAASTNAMIIDRLGSESRLYSKFSDEVKYNIQDYISGEIGRKNKTPFVGCAACYTKNIIDKFDLYPKINNEDWILRTEAMISGSVLFFPEVTVKYRVFSKNQASFKNLLYRINEYELILKRMYDLDMINLVSNKFKYILFYRYIRRHKLNLLSIMLIILITISA